RRAGNLAFVRVPRNVVCKPPAGATSPLDVPSPRVLYGDLLLSIFPNQLLPRGFVITVVQNYRVSAPSRRRHAVGSLIVNINHGEAGIVYTVLLNKSEREARWRDGISGHGR